MQNKNQIASVEGLINCPLLKKLYLANNKIESSDKIKDLKDVKLLEELSLELNPFSTNNKTYLSFWLTKWPNLKVLDGKKESELKESKAFVLEELKSGTDSTNPTPDKKGDQGDDISPDNLLKIIANEWKNEFKRLKEKYTNGYKKTKENNQESFVQSGHAEIEGKAMLFIYGNAIEVLDKSEFQKEVEEITFEYMTYNTIVGSSNMKKLIKFEKLKKLIFSNNYIYSFVQISKLEAIWTLRSISIKENDIALTTLWRCFIVYRFPSVYEINGKVITEEEKVEARMQFQHFDKILSTQKLYPNRAIHDKKNEESGSHSSKNAKLTVKKNIETAHEFVNDILNTWIKHDKAMKSFYDSWEKTMKSYVSNVVEELYSSDNKIISSK